MSEHDDDPIRGRGASGAPQAAGPPSDADIRARQRSRARVMALLLGAFVVLIFAISIVKIAAGFG
jgi:hypothetical protein